MAETTFQHTSASLGDDRQRCFDRRRGFALADVLLNVAPVTRPGPHRSVIVIGLGLIKIARIKSDAIGRSQFSMIVVSDMNTATRSAFGGLYAWTRHAQFGGPRATRQQTSCGRENKCCDQRLCHNRSPPPAPIRRHPPRQIKPSLTDLQSLGRPAPEVSAPKLKLPAISSSDCLFAERPGGPCDLRAISWPSSAPRQLSKSEQCNCSGAGYFGRSASARRQALLKKQKQNWPSDRENQHKDPPTPLAQF